MRPTEKIEKFLRKNSISSNPKVNKAVLNELIDEMKKTQQTGKSLNIGRVIMKSPITKLAAAAVIIIAAGLGVIYYTGSDSGLSTTDVIEQEFEGAQEVNLKDSSKIKLHENTKIKTCISSQMRNVELLTGQIDVDVAKGKEPFIVKTEYGDVKALGTKFSMELVNAVLQNTKENLEMLSVKVTEGTVQVSNDKGSTVISKNQTANVEREKAPYDFTQDRNLPPRLIERIQSMVEAMETGNAKKYLSNYNIEALYKLVKGQIKYEDNHPWFSKMNQEDARNLIKAFAEVESQEQIVEMMLGGISNETGKIYVRSVILETDGKHAKADCISKEGDLILSGHLPEWTYYDGDWWQTDD